MAAMKPFHTRFGGDRGAELIELMLVTPILLMLFAAIFDFGMLFRAWETVTNAAREGARVGILPGYASADIKTRVEQYLGASGITASCTSQAFTASTCPVPASAGGCNVCVQSGPAIATPAGSFTPLYVSVMTRQDMPSLGGFIQFFGGNLGTVPIGSSTMMRAEATAGPAGP